jgi:hypothetical protein
LLLAKETLVSQAKDEYAAFTRQAKLHHGASKSIPKSDEEDQKHIADVDGICLQVVEAIWQALGWL